MGDEATRRHRGELFAALAAMGFGSAYVATSFALTAFEPVPAAAWRSLLAAVAVGAFIAARGLRGRATPDRTPSAGVAAMAADVNPDPAARMVRLLVLAFFAGPLFLASMNLAIAHVGAAIAAFVAGLYAVLSAVIAPVLLPERLTPRVLAGFVLALLGTALLAELDPSGTDLAGMGWGLLAAISFALYLVLARRWSSAYRLDGLTVAFSTGVLTAFVLGGFVLLTEPGLLVPARRGGRRHGLARGGGRPGSGPHGRERPAHPGGALRGVPAPQPDHRDRARRRPARRASVAAPGRGWRAGAARDGRGDDPGPGRAQVRIAISTVTVLPRTSPSACVRWWPAGA
jgi:drug/metabolite transporter (DMT)-like permease